MKKILYCMLAGLTLLACSKEYSAPEKDSTNGVIDVKNLVFNVVVNHSDGSATKAVKSGWSNGDVVYLFFEDNTSNYVKMTFDGSSWAYSDKDGGSAYTDLELSSSGKSLTAVYLPFNPGAPTYSSGWSFPQQFTYYLSAVSGYTVTTDPSTDVSTLDATLSMAAPAGYVQFLYPAVGPVAGKYALMVPYITPAACGIINGGSTVEPVEATVSSVYTANANGYGMGPSTSIVFPMPAYTVAGEGYYFYGIVAPAKRGVPTSYTASLVEMDPTEGYAIGTQTKTFTKALYTVTAGVVSQAAIKFTTAFNDQQPYVDLGLYSNTKWATGNLGNVAAGSPKILSPSGLGEYFCWGDIVPIGKVCDWRPSVSPLTNINWASYVFSWDCSSTNGSKFSKYVPTSASSYWDGAGDPDNKLELELTDDAANSNLKTYKELSWKLPTKAQFDEIGLCFSNKEPISDAFIEGGRYYRIGTGPNGLKIKYVFGGWYAGTNVPSNTNLGIYLTSTLANVQNAYYMQFGAVLNGRSPASKVRFGGALVRPVVNE